MRRRILDYFRYELPENLFDKILLFFLGLFFYRFFDYSGYGR